MNRILFLANTPPETGYGGGERTLSICNALQKLAVVDVLIIPAPDKMVTAAAGQYVVNLLSDPGKATRWYWRKRNYLLMDFRADKNVAAKVRELHRMHNYDAFFGRQHVPFLASCAQLGPSFVDVDDVPTDSWRSPIESVNRLRQAAFWKALSQFKTVFVTKRADIIKVGHADVRILPCISTRPGKTGELKNEGLENRMLFVGGTAWAPNREGILRFIKNTLPIIRGKIADATIRVVGAQGRMVLGPPGVSADDFIDDLSEEYRRAKLFVCPIYSGAGSVVKLAEAAIYGQTIVATSFAARGYEGIFENGRDFLVADSDETFAEHCVVLLRNESLRKQLGRNALMAAQAHLRQENIDGILREAMSTCIPLAS